MIRYFAANVMRAGHRQAVAGRVLALAMMLVPGLTPAPGAAQPRVLELDAAQLTRQVEPGYPQRRCLGVLACVTLSEPRVRLDGASGRVLVAVRASPVVAGSALPEGTVEIGGKPRWSSADAALFAHEPAITALEFPGLDVATRRLVASLAEPMMSQALDATPVWRPDTTDPEQALAAVLLQEVTVVGDRLRVVFGR